MKTLILAICGLIISGCASVQPVTMKDGKQLYQATCRRSQADCHALASKTCDGSYDVLDVTTFYPEFNMSFTCKTL